MSSDPLTREKHHRMVQAMLARQHEEESRVDLERVVNCLSDRISNQPLTELQMQHELSALAGLFKRHGASRAEWLDAVHWLEAKAGFKLIKVQ